MFTVVTSKGIFKVSFQHFNENDSKFTECSLLREDKTLVLKGSSYCNPYDNFSRSIGRKLSLTRMLELASTLVGLNKEDRELVWDKYFESLLNNNDKLDISNLSSLDNILTTLMDLRGKYGNLNVVIPQVGNDISGAEIQWNANVSFVIVDKDDDGKTVVKIF